MLQTLPEIDGPRPQEFTEAVRHSCLHLPLSLQSLAAASLFLALFHVLCHTAEFISFQEAQPFRSDRMSHQTWLSSRSCCQSVECRFSPKVSLRLTPLSVPFLRPPTAKQLFMYFCHLTGRRMRGCAEFQRFWCSPTGWEQLRGRRYTEQYAVTCSSIPASPTSCWHRTRREYF